MRGLSFHRRIISLLFVGGVVMVIIGIKICFDNEEIKKKQAKDKEGIYAIDHNDVTATLGLRRSKILSTSRVVSCLTEIR